MPTISVNGAQLYYEESGTGPQTVVFAHGLGWSTWLFHPQIAVLKDRYRCLAFDFRGQGRSQVTKTGYDLDTLAVDTAELILQLKAAPCHLVGLSMGGMIGIRLALRRPELLRSLVLLNATAEPEAIVKQVRYRLMARFCQLFGVRPILNEVLRVLVSPHFMSNPARSDLRAECRRQLERIDRFGICQATLGVCRRAGLHREIGKICHPTLIIAGAEDQAISVSRARALHAGIAGSSLLLLDGVGHASAIEAPEAVTRALADFLARVPE